MELYDQCHPVSFMAHGTRLCPGDDPQALLTENLSQALGDFWLVARQDARSACDDSHLAAKASKHLAQFKGNVATAQDEQRAGEFGQFQVLLVGEQITREIRGLGEPWEVGDEWRGPGGDEHRTGARSVGQHQSDTLMTKGTTSMGG